MTKAKIIEPRQKVVITRKSIERQIVTCNALVETMEYRISWYNGSDIVVDIKKEQDKKFPDTLYIQVHQQMLKNRKASSANLKKETQLSLRYWKERLAEAHKALEAYRGQ